MTRRDCLRETAALAAAVAAGEVAAAAPTAAHRPLPTIRLGKLRVAKLVLGSNPFFGFAHQPGDLGRKMMEYFTDGRIRALLDEAADLGITAVAAPVYPRWVELWKRYRGEGGKLPTWIAQPDPEPDAMPAALTTAAKGGAGAIFIQGMRVDDQFRDGRFGRLPDWLKQIHDLGLPAGMASHRPDTHPRAQELGLPVDFFFQCLYPNDEFRREDRDRAALTIGKLTKPVIAYKVMAAGRNQPEEALRFAFRHLKAKDGLCVGIYPPAKPNMLAEDAALVRRLAG